MPLSWEDFMKLVNAHLINLCGLRADDIDDYNYRDAFDQKKSPKVTAAAAYRAAKRASGMGG